MGNLRIVQFVIIIVMSAVTTASAAVPQGVDLASMGDWDIVVAQDAIESELFAAQEFQDFFAKASGVTLPMTHDIEDADRHVYIGLGPAMRDSGAGFSVDGFGPEDLRIVVREKTIVIAGGRPRGTLYGVYTFLEDYLGVRFLTADHTHVPPVGHWRRIGPVDRFYHPPMDYRWVAYQANYALPAFAARLRLNAARVPISPVGATDGRGVGKYGGRTPMRRVGHSFNRQLPPATYAKDHPEYFCLYKGTRLATVKPGEGGFDFKRRQFPYGMQPCLTHPDVKNIVTQSVLDEFAARPEVLNVSVAPNDGSKHCECEPCAAIDEREGGHSGAVLMLVNAVADKVARKFPDRMVGTLAYSDTADPPQTLKPRDNVQIMWCSIGTCFIHAFDDVSCPQNKWFISRQLRIWSRMTKNLYAWNYYLGDEHDGYQRPLPNLRLIGPNIRFQMSLGIKGMFMHGTSSSHGNSFEDLRNYILSNLLWDPSGDDRALMREWLNLHYGPAAPPIARWIDRLHDRSVASGKHCRGLGGTMIEMGLDETDAHAGIDAFAQAIQLASADGVVRMRVEKASITAYRAAIDPVWNPKEGQTFDPAVVEKMRPLIERFFELCKKHGTTRTGGGSHRKITVIEGRMRRVLGL